MFDDKISDWTDTAEHFIDDGNPRGARACAREILELDPDSPDGLSLLAETELYLGDLESAARHADAARALDNKNLRARLVLGGVAAERFDLDVELPTLRSVADAARLSSDRNTLFKALTWLSNGLYLAGDPDSAADCLLEASSLKSERAAELYGKYLFYLNYRRPPSREVSSKYQSFFVNAARVERSSGKHGKIRVGYISPDFRLHAVANFVEPFLKRFDEKNFAVYCYNTGRADGVTARLRKNKVLWRDANKKNESDIARSIAADHIDILIDLSGHTQNSCLPILAHRPAPVQITAIGYVGSTGLDAVDYFLSDEHCLPSSASTDDFTEKVLRMPDCHLCYAPTIVRAMPGVSETPPSVERGHITFGSFNNFAKISDRVLELWRSILDGVEGSRMIVKAKTCSIESGREIVRRRLSRAGIDPTRVELREFSPDYLEQYSDVDIALDTFPYNGGLTTCEALCMGVPVIALEGRWHGSRIASSILHSARSDELIAATEDEYVASAIGLAHDVERLKHYRATLRQSMENSPLMDQKVYMQNFEAILKNIFVSR